MRTIQNMRNILNDDDNEKLLQMFYADKITKLENLNVSFKYR